MTQIVDSNDFAAKTSPVTNTGPKPSKTDQNQPPSH